MLGGEALCSWWGSAMYVVHGTPWVKAVGLGQGVNIGHTKSHEFFYLSREIKHHALNAKRMVPRAYFFSCSPAAVMFFHKACLDFLPHFLPFCPTRMPR